MDWGESYDNWYKSIKRMPGRYTKHIELFFGLKEEEWQLLEGVSIFKQEEKEVNQIVSKRFSYIASEVKKELPSNYNVEISSPPGGRGADWTGVAIQIYDIAKETTGDFTFWLTTAAAIKKAIKWVRQKRKFKPILSVGAIRYLCFENLYNDRIADLSTLEFLGVQDIDNQWGVNFQYDDFDIYVFTFIDSKKLYYFFTNVFGEILTHGLFEVPKEMQARR